MEERRDRGLEQGPADAIRVVQWATGTVGRRALRHILGRPDLELVGVKVHDEAKAGRDAGTLVDGAPIGVACTTSAAEVMDLAPDCVVHTPMVSDAEATTVELETLLGAGINVVTTAAGAAVHPPSMPPGLRRRYEAACERGGATMRAAGLSPGFANDVLPSVLTSIVGSVRHVHVSEYADMAHYESHAIAGLLGWGRPPGYVLPEAFKARIDTAFVAPLRVVAASIGVDLDDVELDAEPAYASGPFDIATGHIETGTLAGWRFRYRGLAGGQVAVTIDTTWWLDAVRGTRPGWPATEGWDVHIDGEPEVRLHWEVGPANGTGSRSPDRMTAAAAHLVNLVPVVVDAQPGLVSVLDRGWSRASWTPGSTG